MATKANTFRITTVKAIDNQILALSFTIGILLKSFRDLSDPSHGKNSFTQKDVYDGIKSQKPNSTVTIPLISNLENGNFKNVKDKNIKEIVDFVLITQPQNQRNALINLMISIKNNHSDIRSLKY